MMSNNLKDNSAPEPNRIDYAEFIRAPDIDLGISAKDKARLVSRCERPDKRNVLWTSWIAPWLVNGDLNQHIPIHEHKKSNFAHQGSERAAALVDAEEMAQLGYSLFSNILSIPAFQNDDGTWQRPRERCTIGPFLIFTFEADHTELQQQVNWLWSKDDDGQTAIDRLDQYLSAHYKDYRGYCAVWSGNKSVHFHLLFSSAHLSRATLEVVAKAQGKNPAAQIRDHWHGDLEPDLLWDYYSDRWDRLAYLFRDVAGITDSFDASLRGLHQKRRLPWGLREAEAGNTFGLKEGDLIPQAVLEENIRRTSAKGAEGYLLSAEEARCLPPLQRSKPLSGRKSVSLVADELLPILADYLRDRWGNEYPKPARITEETNGITVRFYNSADDQNPRSFISEDYRCMLWFGRDIPAGETLKPLPDTSVTLGELLIELQAELDAKAIASTVAKSGVRNRPSGSPINQLFERSLLSTAPKHYRSAMSVAARQASSLSACSMIVSAEGGGKTTAAIRDAGRFRLEDCLTNFFGTRLDSPECGFQVVAGSSYRQAEEHYQAYRAWWSEQTDHADIEFPAPVLLMSFAEGYKRYCITYGVTAISYSEALGKGYDSLVEAVYALQPKVFDQISREKNEAWKVPGLKGRFDNAFHNPTTALIFTTHEMAQTFNRPTLSKAWLHPEFDPLDIQNAERWIELATQFRLYRMIHDEVSLSDLLHLDSAHDVSVAGEFKVLVKKVTGMDWSKVGQSQRLQILNDHGSVYMKGLGFHALCRIIDIGYDTADLNTVDFHAHPFGINNKDDAMYVSTHGSQYYLRPKNWWVQQNCRVLITTTEALVAQVARWINKGGERIWVPQIRVHRLDGEEFLAADYIKLRREKGASKKGIGGLVRDMLDNGADHIITDMANNASVNVSTHISSRGRNDLQDKNIRTILTFLAKDEYARLNVIAQRFGVSDIYHLHYRDRLNQAVGRNRGLRQNFETPCEHEVVVSPTLYRCLGGGDFFQAGRYPAYLQP
ncbi:hypothetical protein OL67_003336 [Phaeobacter piscinae]|nr:hypothetical protein OL67_003336 [Phaeobacter piscinae]